MHDDAGADRREEVAPRQSEGVGNATAAHY